MSYPGLLIFDESRGASGVRSRVAGLSSLDRGVRTMVRAGVSQLLVIVPEGSRTNLTALTQQLDVEVEFVTWGQTPKRSLNSKPDASKPTLVVLGDYVHHHSSLTELVGQGLRNHDVVIQTASLESEDHEARPTATTTTLKTRVCTCRRVRSSDVEEVVSGGFVVSIAKLKQQQSVDRLFQR